MTYTYIGAISEGFPNVQVSSHRADTYEDLQWKGGDPMPTKAELDAWIANKTAIDMQQNSLNRILQIRDGIIPVMQGTSRVIPDNSVPSITEGFELWSTTFTPTVVGSKLLINYTFMADHSTSGRIITTTLWADTVCLGVMSSYISSSTRPTSITLSASYITQSSNSVNITARVGGNGSGTAYINRAAAATYGGVINTTYTITETLSL